VNKRASGTSDETKEIKKPHEDDFRYLNDKIDTQIGQVRNEIAQLNHRIDTVIQLVRDESSKINQRFDANNSQTLNSMKNPAARPQGILNLPSLDGRG
jgi:archaellum component FlaC